MFLEVNIFDVGITAVLLLFLLKGLKNGFFLEIVYIGGFFIALVVTLRLLPKSAHWVNKIIELPPHMSAITGFAIVFALVMLIYQAVVAFVHKTTTVQIVDWLNRLGGALVGLLKGATVVSMLCLMIALFPLSQKVVDAQEDSFLFARAKRAMPVVYSVVKRGIPGTPDFVSILEDTFLSFDLSSLDAYSRKLLEEFGSKRAQEIMRAVRQ